MQALYAWSAGVAPGPTSEVSAAPIWLLGQLHSHCDSDDAALGRFLVDLHSRVWMTYRRDFVPIGSSPYTSDAGWGCMLRTTQMLVAHALVVCYLGRDWRLPIDGVPLPDKYYQILQLFEDAPFAPFSIHRIALQGLHLEKQIGQWLGPNTAATALKQLMYLHAPEFRCYVSDDGIIYWDQIERLSSEPRTPLPQQQQHQQQGGSILSVPPEGGDASGWKPVLIIVPLRLGLDALNEIYYHSICETFEYPQSVGILGGKPRASYYFIGHQEEHLLYLDPHTIQPAVCMEQVPFDHKSYHCDVLRKLHLSEMDPSMALGFFCKTRHDLQDLFERAQRSSTVASSASIVNVAFVTPEYERRPVTTEASLDDDISSFVVL